MNKHRAIITGATGYIGSHLAKYLLSEGWDIHIIAQPEFGYHNIDDIKDKIDLFEYNNDIDNLIGYFQSVQADVVFHLAAAVITNYNASQIKTLIQSNVQFGTEILEAMKHSGTSIMINTGSYWQNYNSDEYNPVDLYAATKEAYEKIIQYYVDAHNLRVITLRLYDIYGEDDKRPKIWSILRDIAGTDKALDVSPGEQYLDLVHISDVCKAYLSAYKYLSANNQLKNEIYGVCTGQLHTLKQLVMAFEKAIGKPVHINWGAKPYKQREVMNPVTTYKRLPEWKAEILPEEGFLKFKQ